MNVRVKTLRKILNLTQQEFGGSIKLSKSSIGNIENGIINLTDRNISNICESHNVNEQWLRTGNGDMFVQLDDTERIVKTINTFPINDIKKSCIKELLSLSNEDDCILILNLIKKIRR
ncbi:helix-turn-helix domain-containing protein [Clostridium septicum]|uniref:helix-turn-helix domain-containing protein n=1 Tax=Clostridium septicum TaxID=1504 RepID=UPI000833BB9F|nr:helix-turn-helix transcriptional regulator [Clostridium septicum]